MALPIDPLLKLINEKLTFPFRYKFLANFLSPYLRDSRSALDIGSANGYLAKRVGDRLGVRFIGVDVYIQPETHIETIHYDGLTLPFSDDSFDTAMLIDVLHHADQPRRLLEEARRVSRRYVIIKDHYWRYRYDKPLLQFADWLGNQPYGIRLKNGYLCPQEWTHLILSTRLKTLERKQFKCSFLDPCRNIFLWLEKQGRR